VSRYIEPVSRSLALTQGVRVTGGGAPLPDVLRRRPEPALDAEAIALLQSLAPHGRSAQPIKESLPKWAEGVISKPSRAGVQALAWAAWTFREGARKTWPADASAELNMARALEKLGAAITTQLDGTQTAANVKLLAGLYVSAYEAGAKDALTQVAEDKSKPTLVREVEFHEDSRGHVVGKTEKEYIVKEARK
jgi:hypothetical protein